MKSIAAPPAARRAISLYCPQMPLTGPWSTRPRWLPPEDWHLEPATVRRGQDSSSGRQQPSTSDGPWFDSSLLLTTNRHAFAGFPMAGKKGEAQECLSSPIRRPAVAVQG